MKRIFWTAMVLAMAPCAAAKAQQAPAAFGIEQYMEPGERQFLPEFAAAQTAPLAERLGLLNTLLAKLDRPTRFRGIVQVMRASFLADGKPQDAIVAIEEAMRLLPDIAHVKLTAAHIMTYGGAPQRAADLWIAASYQDPGAARLSGGYNLDSLRGRLIDLGDRRRADALSARMRDIGLNEVNAVRESSMTLAGVRARVSAGDIDGARQLIGQVVSPADLIELYVDRRYEALWPAIERWHGVDLVRGQSLYLAALRRDWQAAGTFDTATDYARVLARLRAFDAAVGLFLPRLSGPMLSDEEDIEFITPVIARSLVGVGRGDEALALLARVEKLIPAEHGTRRLNFGASQAQLNLWLGRYAVSAGLAAQWVEAGMARGTDVNASAMFGVKAVQACALIHAGRAKEAEPIAAAVLLAGAAMPEPAMQVHICRRDAKGARALLIESLKSENRRIWALNWVQPRGAPLPTDHMRAEQAFMTQVAAHPDVRAAAEKVGRILPRALDVTLPSGFDPAAPADLGPPEVETPPMI